MKYSKYSAVIIGSGIAGLYLAHKLALSNKYKDGILLVTKSKLNESNSRFAQGGIVGVLPENTKDSTSLHISDTIKSGCGLSNFNVVKFISENSATVIQDLLKIGVEFDKTENNKLNFTLEGAHSTPRVLHAGGDCTGKVIENKLCEVICNSKNIEIYEKTLAVELLLNKKGDCKGVLTYNSVFDTYEAIYSNIVILATGGVGQIYKHTTNPSVATGDGLALALNAGASVRDMEFIQFHPTALNVDNEEKMSLISEAVRGEGAKLIDELGNDFTKETDKRGSLAPRDIVSRAIYHQINKKPNSKIYLDISSIGLEKFQKRFPGITEICKENNVDLDLMLIPVAPSAHYCMGGIETKVNGETSIKGLYAIGEVARTGLHGANRLASNSLLECVVCAWELARYLNSTQILTPKMIDDNVKKILEEYEEENELFEIDTKKASKDIKELMWKYVGIIRDEDGLKQALVELIGIEKRLNLGKKCLNREQYELRNMFVVARNVIKSALNRKETIGAHFRSDWMPDVEKIKEIRSNDEVFA